MRKGTLVAAVGVLAVVCSACSGSSRSSAVGHPGTTSLGPGGAASGSVSSSPATVPAIPEPGAAGSGASWTVYHGNAEATGVQAAQIKLLPSRRAWTSPILDGQLYGEPLVADGRIVAATENDTVYVMAARSGRILWSRHLANPVPSHDLPCGDISPVVGITGTPVIDLTRHEIFVDADTLIRGPSSSGGVEASHRLFGLDLFTGKVELSQPAMPSAGEDQLAQLQRPGLALDHGRVVIAYGQNTGDCPGPNGPAHGYIVSIPETGGPLDYFQVGSGRDRGAVWMGGSSPVVDPQGNVYVASADGYNLGAGQPYDDSDAVLELSPAMHQAPYLKQLWTGNDGAAGAPIIADGLVWTIGADNAVHGLNPASGKQVVSIPFGGAANHFPTPSAADGLLLLPGTSQVFAFMGPAGLPPAPLAS